MMLLLLFFLLNIRLGGSLLHVNKCTSVKSAFKHGSEYLHYSSSNGHTVIAAREGLLFGVRVDSGGKRTIVDRFLLKWHGA